LSGGELEVFDTYRAYGWPLYKIANEDMEDDIHLPTTKFIR